MNQMLYASPKPGSPHLVKDTPKFLDTRYLQQIAKAELVVALLYISAHVLMEKLLRGTHPLHSLRYGCAYHILQCHL